MFEKKITLGNILQICAALGTVVGAYYVMSGRLDVLELRLDYVESDLRDLNTRIEKRLDSLDTKLDRVLEGR